MPLAEFILNNRDTEPTSISPFFADYRRNIRSLPLGVLSHLLNDRAPSPVRLLREDARAFAKDMRKLYKELNEELT